MKSEHQLRVEDFMHKAGQFVPDKLAEPTVNARLLRAKLIIEEALEVVRKGLGISVSDKGNCVELKIENLRFDIVDKFDILETADGCADLSVVNTGTMSAVGIHDSELLVEVDKNNLSKFADGYSIRDDGKLIKPHNYVKPDIYGVLKNQGLQ